MKMDELTSINLRTEVLEKLKNALNDSVYRETIESSSNYNNRLVIERKTRIPFIDSQTGVAQNDCYLWMQKWERMPGITKGQLYSYPVRRWKKKRRSQYLLNNYALANKSWEKNTEKNNFEVNFSNGHENTNDSISVKNNDRSHEMNDKFFDNTSKDGWVTEIDEVTEFTENVENDENESDDDDFEEYSSRKKRKKKNENITSGKKKKSEVSSNDKPYKCDLCGMKYKTRPGLSYHYSHTHSVEIGDRKNIVLEEEDSQHSNSSSFTGTNNINSRTSQISNSTSNSPLPPNSSVNQISLNLNNSKQTNSQQQLNSSSATPVSPLSYYNNKSFNEESKSTSKYKKGSAPSNYCDFCLGNHEINKKTRSSEEMISCADCGRSAHPTCLQFTENMLKSVKKYRWQCIECKSCGLCGTSDNDEQLLFCDDCDRGYHMYCLKPPLSEPPEGSWSCHLCIEEYYQPKSTENPINSNSNLNNFLNNNLNNTNKLNNNNHSSIKPAETNKQSNSSLTEEIVEKS